MARFLVQTIPNKLPELLINLSSQGPHSSKFANTGPMFRHPAHHHRATTGIAAQCPVFMACESTRYYERRIRRLEFSCLISAVISGEMWIVRYKAL